MNACALSITLDAYHLMKTKLIQHQVRDAFLFAVDGNAPAFIFYNRMGWVTNGIVVKYAAEIVGSSFDLRCLRFEKSLI